MNSIQERVADSFQSRGFMATLGAQLVSVADGEVQGERFLATGRVLSSGRLLTICAGEVRASSGSEWKVIANMQATIVNVQA